MKVDFILDICCLWSYIAWRQLQNAMQEIRIKADITPFFIPSGTFFPGFEMTPAEKARMLEKKAAPFLEQSGLFVNFDRLPDLSGDLSRPVHLVQAAFARKKFNVLNELFSAFFAFGRDITDPAVLKPIALYHSLTEKDFTPFSFRAKLPVNMPEGLHAVPCMIFDKSLILFGAQSVPCLKNVLCLSRQLQRENAF